MNSLDSHMVTPLSSKTPNSQEDVQTDEPKQTDSNGPMEVEEDEISKDFIEKLKNQDILPDLFSLLRDLQTGVISAKDFDNNAGSLRLKLSDSKVLLKQIPGIIESVPEREQKIEKLVNSCTKRKGLLLSLRDKVNADLDHQG